MISALPRPSVANHSHRAREAGAHHWLSHERFIQAYKNCRGRDWSYGTLAPCLKFNTAQMLNSSSWQHRYPSCDGSQQSPIPILFSWSEYKHFEPIQFFNYDSRLQLDVELFGTTVFFYPFGLDLGVFGGPLNVQYSFFMGTLHFGMESETGSEHIVENQRYAAEVRAWVNLPRPRV
ncbi:carbonic anhydrase 4-like [Amblyomma americanum]